MANFSVSFSVRDADGHSSVVRGQLVAADIAAAIARAQATALLINAVVLGQITQILVAQDVAVPGGVRAAPTAGCDVEVKGRFIYGSTGGYSTRMSLPTFNKDAKTVIGGDINTADADVLAFNTEILNNGWADSRYADILTLNAAYEAFSR